MTTCRAVVLGAAALLALFSATACAPVGLGVGAAATAGTAAAQERGFRGAVDDTKIAAQINHLLFQHDHVLFSKVNIEVHEGRVLLTGNVPTPEARVDAVRLAWQAAGVRELLNEIQVTDQAGVIDYGRDVMIANELRGRLLFDKQIRNINYSVETVNGVVYLMGIAHDQQELDRVLGHARNIEYVRRVVNYVLLRDDPRRQQQPGT